MPIQRFATAIIPSHTGDCYFTMHHYKKTENPWRFPGGRIEPGEVPIQALARELMEECDMEATTLILVHITDPFEVDGGKWQGYFFLAEGSEPRIMEPDKFDKAEWLDKQSLLDRGSFVEHNAVKVFESSRS